MGKHHVILQYTLTAFIYIGLAIAYFVVYGLYKSQSEGCEKMLDVWTLVSGISIVVSCGLTFGILPESLENADLSYTERVSKPLETTLGKTCYYLTAVVNLFNFCWFIVGNVWTFDLGCSPSANCAPACYNTLFLFCFCIIIIQWCLVGLVCLIACGFIGAACCCGAGITKKG